MAKVNFMEQLENDLREKKQLSESSIQAYLRNLKKLNNDEPLKNFNFLKNPDIILHRLNSYKETTKKNYIVSIVSALSLYDKPALQKLHKKYYALMEKKAEEIQKEIEKNEMTEPQEKNWISWDNVLKRYSELEDEVNGFYNSKLLSESQYNLLLAYVILSLYVHQVPRRNKDYQILYIVNNYSPELPKDRNYLSLGTKEFIFNIYKTSYKYGTQRISINDKLWEALLKYFKHHPNVQYKNNSPSVKAPTMFLVYANKTALDKVNSITRILNKIFDKNIGSSMLRHIFLSDKYGGMIESQKKDAYEMAHSLSMQKDYIKKPSAIIVKF